MWFSFRFSILFMEINITFSLHKKEIIWIVCELLFVFVFFPHFRTFFLKFTSEACGCKHEISRMERNTNEHIRKWKKIRLDSAMQTIQVEKKKWHRKETAGNNENEHMS